MTFHIRDAFKSLRRDPAFCITVILTLALATGATAGIPGALAMGSIVASLLFGVRARDPLIIAGVIAIVGGIGLLACLIAARRGLVLNPAAALREESGWPSASI